MNEYLVNDTICVTRYVCVTTDKYAPCEERGLFEDMGYEYKGGSECFGNSIYTFEYRNREGMTSITAKSREEAQAIYWEGR